MPYDPLTTSYWLNYIRTVVMPDDRARNEIVVLDKAEKLLDQYETYLEEGGENVEGFLATRHCPSCRSGFTGTPLKDLCQTCLCHRPSVKCCVCENSHGQQTLNGVPNGYCIDCNRPIRPSVEPKEANKLMGDLHDEIDGVEPKYAKIDKDFGKDMKLEINAVPSPRIDWCSDCQAEHGFDCPKDKPSVEGKEVEFIGGAEKQIKITRIKIGDDYFVPQSHPSVEPKCCNLSLDRWGVKTEDGLIRCPECKKTYPATPPVEGLDEAVRDICAIPYRAKSEVRRIIQSLLHVEREKVRNEADWWNEKLQTAYKSGREKGQADERERIVRMCEEMKRKGMRGTLKEFDIEDEWNSALSSLRDKLTNK